MGSMGGKGRSATGPRRVLVLVGTVCVALAMTGNGVAGATVEAARRKCSKKPFVGTVERTAESTSGTGQPAAERTTADFRSAVVFDFGGSDKNYTVYLGDHRIDPDDFGQTLTAPEDGVLVSVFLRSASGKSLRTGTKLVAGKDPMTVLVDAGGGASAITSNPKGTVKLLASSDTRLCFAIDYADDYQTVDGVVSAQIP
jgi:hypothetical protein